MADGPKTSTPEDRAAFRRLLEGEIVAAESAADYDRWQRAVRRLLIQFEGEEPDRIEVSPAWHQRLLEMRSQAPDNFLSSDCGFVACQLMFRRRPVVEKPRG